MKEISLSNSPLKFLVDDEDYEKLNQYTWRLDSSGYAVSMLSVHQFLLGNSGIDHKDTNKLNNQKHNLRRATRNQQRWNSPKHKTYNKKPTSSKYKGVRFENDRWRAKIVKNGREYYLGTFYTEVEAAIAYNHKAVELFGKFAKINVLEA